MKKDYTHVTLVLDRSGSMSSIRNDVVGGLNTFLEGQRAVGGECTFTLIQFDSQSPYELLHDFKLLEEVPPLKPEDFIPRGGTPLYDALGRGIFELGQRLGKMEEPLRPDKVIFVTLTDGHENASIEYTKPRIAEMTRLQREIYNWQFVYLGADQDAMDIGRGIGHMSSHSASYSKNNAVRAMGMSSRKLAAYRSSGRADDLNYDRKDRAELMDPNPAPHQPPPQTPGKP